MVNYSLEDFKAWLAEKPERKEGLDWARSFNVSINTNDRLEKLIKKIDIIGIGRFASSDYWVPYHQVALKWLAERERERESQMKGIIW